MTPPPSFNSTLVRLKGDESRQGTPITLDKFQFHSGSIKSYRLLDADMRYRLDGFNSTLVRLKESPVTSSPLPVVCFNSTLVRLKAEWKDSASIVSSCFNSTLVRLKVDTVVKALSEEREQKFQFHSGSIKR